MSSKLSVIYRIRNLINNKVYIGSALIFNNRKYAHLWKLRHNCHHSHHLQAAWNKYGEENFVFEILEIITDSALLIEREQFYLDKIQSFKNDIGYNHLPTANSTFGYTFKRKPEHIKSGENHPMFGKKHSKDTIKKMSDSRIGNKNSNYGKSTWNKGLIEERSLLSVKIEQLDFNNKLIKVWSSLSEIHNKLGYSKSNICSCCKGQRSKANGYKWKYHEL